MEMAARPAVFATWMTLIEGIYRLLLSDEHLPVNIGNPAEISILHFAEVINQMVGNKAGNSLRTHQAVGDDPQRRQPDITRAREILHWQPTTNLETGLASTIQYFRAQMGLQ